LEKAFVFHVSFDNGTPLTRQELRDPWNAIGIRMLGQLLGGNIENIAKNMSHHLMMFSNSSRLPETLTCTTISLEF